MPTINDLDILVLGNKKKENITEQFLKKENLDHRTYWNPDWQWNGITIIPQYYPLTGGNKGALNCYRGHQELLKLATKEYILVFEDDVTPNDPNWQDVVLSYLECLKQFEIISMHGRDFKKHPFTRIESNPIYNLYLPKPVEFMKGITGKWVLGSCAYIIKNESDAYHKILNEDYVGIPMDLYIANSFNFAVLDKSPFDHDRSKGSLIDSAPFDYPKP